MRTKTKYDTGFFEEQIKVVKVWRNLNEWITGEEIDKFLDPQIKWCRDEIGRYIGVEFNGKNEMRFTKHTNDWYERIGDYNMPIMIIARPREKKYHVIKHGKKVIPVSKTGLKNLLINYANLH